MQPVPRAGPPARTLRLRRPENTGYRQRFFQDRAIATVAEHTLSQGLAALRTVDAKWPLEDDLRFADRLDIACLVAIHIVRTPAFRHHVDELQNRALPGYQLGEQAMEPFLQEVTSEGFRVSHMLGMIPKLASLIASAHWSLIEFQDRLLATSDQPVSIVPVLPEGMSAPVSAVSAGGFLLAEEYRFPIDRSTRCSSPGPTNRTPPARCSETMTSPQIISGSDREWFHNPERRPTMLPLDAVPTSVCFPIGRLLLPDYGMSAVLESQRRIDASACLVEMIENEVTDHFHVARVAVPVRSSVGSEHLGYRGRLLFKVELFGGGHFR